MKIIFSRKGFDSGRKSGGTPSPIIDGVPYSLPIPTNDYPSKSKYRDLGLGEPLSKVNTKGDLTADSFCHEDPMFWGDRCAFGQTGVAQSHLGNEGRGKVGEGDVFLFFGLFSENGRDRHHRIFGYLKVEKKFEIGAHISGEEVWRALAGTCRQHPHTIEDWDNGGKWDENNTIYFGHGRKARNVHRDLRLTKRGCSASHWAIPKWLRKHELTYHRNPNRWLDDATLRTVSRGQEFVAEIGDRAEPREWLDKMVALIETGP